MKRQRCRTHLAEGKRTTGIHFRAAPRNTTHSIQSEVQKSITRWKY